MPAAANLQVAAVDAFDNLHTLWLADTLKAKLTAFNISTLAIFPQEDPNNHPCSNWAVLLYGLSDQMPLANVPYDGLITAADWVYRLCWVADRLDTDGLITAAQATALLAAYNLQFT